MNAPEVDGLALARAIHAWMAANVGAESAVNRLALAPLELSEVSLRQGWFDCSQGQAPPRAREPPNLVVRFQVTPEALQVTDISGLSSIVQGTARGDGQVELRVVDPATLLSAFPAGDHPSAVKVPGAMVRYPPSVFAVAGPTYAYDPSPCAADQA